MGNQLLSRFPGCQEKLRGSDSIGALPQGGEVVAFSDGGERLAQITLGSGEGDRWARAAGDEVTYRVTSFRVGRVAPKREDVQGGG